MISVGVWWEWIRPLVYSWCFPVKSAFADYCQTAQAVFALCSREFIRQVLIRLFALIRCQTIGRLAIRLITADNTIPLLQIGGAHPFNVRQGNGVELI